MSNGASRTVLVTGATGAIGYAICQALARTPDLELVLVGRDEARTRRAAEQLRLESGHSTIQFELADLSREQEIVDLAARRPGPLHVLLNNAAVTPRTRQETAEGIELQFATNVLGYVWATLAFRHQLAAAARDGGKPARIVNVASNYAGDLDLDDLQFQRRPYDNRRAYRQSKQANRMLTAAFAARLAPEKITVNACHPGDVSSRLSNNLGFGGPDSAEQGAQVPAWLATSPDVAGVSGRYFWGQRAVMDPFAEDRRAVERLYEICMGFWGKAGL